MTEKKRKTKSRGLPPEFWEQHENAQRLLAERIAYHEARIAAAERGHDPEQAVATTADVERLLSLDRRAWHERAQQQLAERIAYHRARIAARERGEDPDTAVA
jgi:hypothetical protein